MRISKFGPAACACLAVISVPSLFAQKLELKVLSGRPDMVSGGSALVQVNGASPDSLKVHLNNQPVPADFRPARTGGALVGRVEGLNAGANSLQISDGHGTQKIVLINHPISGPVFSGP